jgi:hypothetical protein
LAATRGCAVHHVLLDWKGTTPCFSNTKALQGVIHPRRDLARYEEKISAATLIFPPYIFNKAQYGFQGVERDTHA